jgi:hypothetical protein
MGMRDGYTTQRGLELLGEVMNQCGGDVGGAVPYIGALGGLEEDSCGVSPPQRFTSTPCTIPPKRILRLYRIQLLPRATEITLTSLVDRKARLSPNELDPMIIRILQYRVPSG